MPFLTLVLVSGVGVMVRDRNVQVGAEEVIIWGWRWAGVMKRGIWAGRQPSEYTVDVRLPCVKRVDDMRPSISNIQVSPRPDLEVAGQAALPWI